ncbi:MAG: DUF1214 domain-containing protein [Halioglobus sp.]
MLCIFGSKAVQRFSVFMAAIVVSCSALAADTVEDYIREFPSQQQTRMMNAWLKNNQPGTFVFSGLVDPSDTTVVTPQATVDYGYNWFSVSNGPAIINTPSYDRFFSVSIFDMKHNTPAVIVNPQRPIIIVRPGQAIPEGDFTVVELETDQGLAFTRMVVVDNMDEVRELSNAITMTGGNGDMNRPVQTFSPEVEKAAMAEIQRTDVAFNPDVAFGKKSGDVDPLVLARAVNLGQLGTPTDSVRYSVIFTDDSGAPLNGKDSYLLTVPAGIVHDEGYYSITLYGTDNKGLIPNPQGRYDRTTFSSTANADGTYTLELNPSGEGTNAIPTGKPFYAVLRAYVPVQGADLKTIVTRLPTPASTAD